MAAIQTNNITTIRELQIKKAKQELEQQEYREYVKSQNSACDDQIETILHQQIDMITQKLKKDITLMKKGVKHKDACIQELIEVMDAFVQNIDMSY